FAQHRRKLLARAIPAGRGGSALGAFARGRLARGGVGAPAIVARRIPLAPLLPRLAATRISRVGRGPCRHVAVEARLLLVVERGVECLQLGLDRVECFERGVDALLHRLEPCCGRGGNVPRAVIGLAALRWVSSGPAARSIASNGQFSNSPACAAQPRTSFSLVAPNGRLRPRRSTRSPRSAAVARAKSSRSRLRCQSPLSRERRPSSTRRVRRRAYRARS